MPWTWIEFLGLVGLTLAISQGKGFDGLRDWLQSFDNPYNPMRWFGKLLSCAMCSGFWVGFVAAKLAGATLGSSIIFGGLLSGASWAAGSFLVGLELVVEKRKPPMEMSGAELINQTVMMQQAKRRMRQLPEGTPPTEDQVDAWMNEQERLEDEGEVDPRFLELLKRKEEMEAS